MSGFLLLSDYYTRRGWWIGEENKGDILSLTN